MKMESPYLTAEQLEIQEWEHTELLALMPRLLNEEIKKETFNMAFWFGDACCIGGHIIKEYTKKEDNLHSKEMSESLKGLFASGISAPRLYNISPLEAGEAIHLFLTTGEKCFERLFPGR